MEKRINNKARFFIDPTTWVKYLSDFKFSFGTRIHGNITSLLSGIPAVVLAHDSRTRELAEYFEIPYKKIDGLEKFDANLLYKEASYEKLNNGHEERYNTFINFLKENGLDNIFSSDDEDKNLFDKKIDKINLPPAIESFKYADTNELLKWLFLKRRINKTLPA